jgi:quercetin dioxygenase-like cupin family protein
LQEYSEFRKSALLALSASAIGKNGRLGIFRNSEYRKIKHVKIMNEPIPPYVLTNENSPAFWLIGNLWMPLAGSLLTGGNFCFLEQLCAAGGGPGTHAHPSDEGLYVVEGHCTFHAGGETVEAGPGTFVSVPRYVEHSFTVDEPNSRLLNFYAPAGFEMLLMSLATPATERKLPAPDAVPMPPRWMVEECSREFGQIPILGLPFADPPTKDNMTTRPSQLNPIKPYGIEVKNAPAYWMQDILWTVFATSEQTGGSYALMEEWCPKHSGPPPHTHEQDEALYLLQGEITLVAGEQKISAKAGSLIYLPAHCVHTFRVDTPEARLLNFYLPGGFERSITEFGTPASSRTLPPSGLVTPGTPEQLKALFKRIGMTPVALPDSLRES